MKKKYISVRYDFYACIILVSMVLAVYGQVLNFRFVNFDDQKYIYNNSRIKSGINVENVRWAFQFSSGRKGVKTYWHPLTWISHMADVQMFGLNPAGHHAINLMFHVFNSILLFIFLRIATGDRWKSFFVAALFALHPINVNSVAWISERKNLLSSFFWFLTMLAYLQYTKKGGAVRYTLIFISLLLGLLAKPMLVTLPFVLFLLDFWPLERIKYQENRLKEKLQGDIYSRIRVFTTLNKRILLEKVPLFVLCLVWVYLSALSVKLVGNSIPTSAVPMGLRISNCMVSYISYLSKILWPFDLAVFYPYPKFISVWHTIGAAMILLFITFLFIGVSKKKTWLLVGWLWFFGTIVPVSGLKQAGLWPAMANRWMYIPIVGLLISLIWGFDSFISNRTRNTRLLTGLASCILLVLAFNSSCQTKYWKNSISLWRHAIDVTSSNSVAFTNLGTALKRKGKLAESFIMLEKALQLNPNDFRVQYNIGKILSDQGKIDQAIIHFSEALKLNPDSSDCHNNFAACLVKKNRLNEAMYHYKEAIRLKPNSYVFYYNLGNLMKKKMLLNDAAGYFEQALKLNPGFVKAKKNLADTMAAIKTDMNGKSVNNNAKYILLLKQGNYFAENNKYDKAIACYKSITRRWPGIAAVYYNLACIYSKQNNPVESIKYLKKAIIKGYRNWNLIKTDKDLEKIRTLPQYRKFMKQLIKRKRPVKRLSGNGYAQ